MAQQGDAASGESQTSEEPIAGSRHPNPSFVRVARHSPGMCVRSDPSGAARPEPCNLPAQRLRLYDRGLIRPGMKADVVVFDAAKVEDKATFERPHLYAVGFKDIVINGKAIIANGELTKGRSGRILHGRAKQ